MKPDSVPGTGALEGYITWPGWDPHEDFLGPFFHKKDGEGYRTAFIVEKKHINGGGATHGGLLMSFADHSIFVFAQDSLGDAVSGVTISLNGEFVSAGFSGKSLNLQEKSSARPAHWCLCAAWCMWATKCSSITLPLSRRPPRSDELTHEACLS